MKLITYMDEHSEPRTLMVEGLLDSFNTSEGWMSKYALGEHHDITIRHEDILLEQGINTYTHKPL